MKKQLLILFAAITTSVGVNAQVIFDVRTPANLAGNYNMSLATTGWGSPDMNDAANAVTQPLAYYKGDTTACAAPSNAAELNGKIVVLWRGGCEFGSKAKRAQEAGAKAVIIINHSGEPVGMGAGADGTSVTIPVIMISTGDGLKLRSEILAGNVTGFIGTKVGLYPNDLGYKQDLILYAPVGSKPLALSGTAGDFVVEPGMWVYNFGSANQTGASVVTTITKNGSSVYSETQGNLTLASGDSVYLEFPQFKPAFTEAAEYTMTYSINTTGSEGYPADNIKKSQFNITNGTFSYAPIDGSTGLPKSTVFTQSSGAAPTKYCINFRDPKADQLSLAGMSFALSGNSANYDLTDNFVELEVFEWNDVFDSTANAAFLKLNSVAFFDYSYTTNATQKTIFVPYVDDPVKFKANQRYLACVTVQNDSINIGFYNSIDYSGNMSVYGQPIAPAKDGATWFSGGFGGEITASIGLHFSNPTGINDVTTIDSEVVPFPTPSNQYVTIPFKAGDATTAEIKVMDLNGRLVSTVDGKVEEGKLKVNTTQLSNGSYIFNVTLNTGKSSAFRIIVNR